MALRSYVLLAASSVLPGCLTNALWYEDVKLPELQTVSVPCEVLEVTTSADRSIHVQFSPQSVAEAPPHVARFDSDRPGSFELRPRLGEDWQQLPGAELFAPSSWDLSISSGTHFRLAPANAQVGFRGVLHPDDVGELVCSEQLPAELRELGELQPSRANLWEAHSVQAFQTHDWMALLSPTSPRARYRPVPLAWVDGYLEPAPPINPSRSDSSEEHEEIGNRLRGLRLLGRLEGEAGETTYVLISVPVLLQGTDLRLRREGAEVHWSRASVWTARLLAGAPGGQDRTPFQVPLRRPSFEYRWSREVEESDWALDSLRVLATPITAALDFAIMTNGPLSRLARFLAGEDQQAVRFEPTDGK